MKLFFKRAGFLMLMLVLGVFSLVAHEAGYPFAWRFSSDKAYWLPLAYALDVLCVLAVLGLLFWGLRGFLFGRGRPWLAWFSIATWVLVWAAYSWQAVGGRTAHWSLGLFVSAPTLNQKVADLRQQPWSAASIKALPEPLREQVCAKAVLAEESRIVARAKACRSNWTSRRTWRRRACLRPMPARQSWCSSTASSRARHANQSDDQPCPANALEWGVTGDALGPS